jgi:hypothetical protein
MRITPFLLALALAFTFALAPSQSVAQEPPKVIHVLAYDVAEQLPQFLELYKRAVAVMEKYGSTGTSRVWMSTLAGPNAGRVAVAIEYPSMAAMVEAGNKFFPSPEWQQLVADFEATEMRLLSNSVAVDLMP